MSTTNYLGLNIPDKNSKGRVVTDVFEPNFTKIDQNAEVVDIDKNAIWGGEYGGYIQDTSVVKVVGKRYIDQFDKKVYICRVAGSHVNTIANYEECNVAGNLDRIKKLNKVELLVKAVDGTVSTNKTWNTKTPVANFCLLSIRFPVGPYPNLDTGADCTEVTAPLKKGYWYFEYKGVQNTIFIDNNSIRSSMNAPEISLYSKGFALLGVINLS